MKFEDRIKECVTANGLDLAKLEEGEGLYGFNGGRGCDVLDGPCSCGAWHKPGEKIQLADGSWVENPKWHYSYKLKRHTADDEP